jgi:hypothetical protein
MKVNFNQALKNLEGGNLVEMSIKASAVNKQREELTNSDFEEKEVMFKSVVANALFKAEKIEDKARAFKLAQEIYSSNKAIEVSSEDITMIKEVVKPLPVMYSGQICIMIEE